MAGAQTGGGLTPMFNVAKGETVRFRAEAPAGRWIVETDPTLLEATQTWVVDLRAEDPMRMPPTLGIVCIGDLYSVDGPEAGINGGMPL